MFVYILYLSLRNGTGQKNRNVASLRGYLFTAAKYHFKVKKGPAHQVVKGEIPRNYPHNGWHQNSWRNETNPNLGNIITKLKFCKNTKRVWKWYTFYKDYLYFSLKGCQKRSDSCGCASWIRNNEAIFFLVNKVRRVHHFCLGQTRRG